jgi:HSP20 family protein
MKRTLVSLSPVAELQQMVNTIDRAFDGFWNGWSAEQAPMNNPVPVDIYEQDGSLFICAAVPGVRPEDLSVTVDENVLTINGETRQEWDSGEGTRVYHREHRYGKFSRAIRLPENLRFDETEAEFNNGFVTIRFPIMREEKPQPRRIEVRNVTEGQQAISERPKQKATNGKHENERELAGSN